MNKILYHLIVIGIVINQTLISAEEIFRSPIFIKNSQEAHELINLLPTIEDNSEENIVNIKTAKMLAEIFEEDKKLDRAFRSWLTTISSGLSTIYQYIVHFWQTQESIIHNNPSTEINPLATAIGNISAHTTEHVTEFFLDNIIGSILSEQVATAIGQTVQNNVTQITNSIIHDLQNQETISCQEDNNQTTTHTLEDSQKTECSIAHTLDEILKRENNSLEQSGSSLNTTFDGKYLLISFQSTLQHNEDSEVLVYLKENQLEINHQKMLFPYQIKLIVSYVLNIPETIKTNCSEITTTIDETGLITLSLPILDEKIEHISKIISEIKLLYCGLGVFEKDLIFCNSTNSLNPSANME